MGGSNIFASVRENSPLGQFISDISIRSDPGANTVRLCLTGPNANWFYLEGRTIRLNSSASRVLDREEDACFFRIDLPNSGKVVLNKPLDYESRTRLQIIMWAQESNTEEKFNISTVLTVNIDDVDDQYPYFLPCTPVSPDVPVCMNPTYSANITQKYQVCQVEDRLKYSLATVLVRVLSVNSFPPLFNTTTFKGFIIQSSSPASIVSTYGNQVLQVQVFDWDFPNVRKHTAPSVLSPPVPPVHSSLLSKCRE
ncbi:hypothetical protein GOODEAATRI_027100 [Goodea atripinnis]|uniref:Cadherin domain-containing protein n=1 Tax=Goodea atripinnis TaxID=208336 RepID=A0ABV0PSE2_9TELE